MRTDLRIVTMNVSLPGPLKRFVDSRVASGLYGSASEFIREAIREKLERESRDADVRDLPAKLLDGLSSGNPIAFSASYIKGKKRAILSRTKRPKKSA